MDHRRWRCRTDSLADLSKHLVGSEDEVLVASKDHVLEAKARQLLILVRPEIPEVGKTPRSDARHRVGPEGFGLERAWLVNPKAVLPAHPRHGLCTLHATLEVIGRL